MKLSFEIGNFTNQLISNKHSAFLSCNLSLKSVIAELTDHNCYHMLNSAGGGGVGGGTEGK